jgi:hypothetical protein
MVSYGGVDGGYRQLSSRCFNADIARLMWVGELRGLPIRADRTRAVTGRHIVSTFERVFMETSLFRVPMNPVMVATSGYTCEVGSDPEDDLLELLARLIHGPCRLLSVRHLVNEGATTEIAGLMVRGPIDRNESAMERTRRGLRYSYKDAENSSVMKSKRDALGLQARWPCRHPDRH